MKYFYFFAVLFLIFVKEGLAQADFSIQGSLCQDNTLEFIDESVVNVNSWLWNFGDGTTSDLQNPTHIYTVSNTFEVSLAVTTSSNTYTAKQTIQISSNPEVRFYPDSSLVFFSTYTRVFIDSSVVYNPVGSYVWDFGDGNGTFISDTSVVTYKYPGKGTYMAQLTVIDTKGCRGSDSNAITINDRFYIPNVFTPNADGINDLFIITSNGVTRFSIEIYSRWGNLVFKQSGQEQVVWDGRMADGTIVNPGTYFYVISNESDNVTYEPQKGFITVYR